MQGKSGLAVPHKQLLRDFLWQPGELLNKIVGDDS
jgi:hypothetical protein